MKTPSNGRAGRVEKRAVKTMGRAQKSWTKAEAVRKNTPSSNKSSNFAQDEFGRTGEQKADQLYRRAARQEAKAKRQMDKANYLKAKKATPKSKLAMKKSLREAAEEMGSMAAVAGTRALMKETTKVSSRVPVRQLTRTTKTMTKKK
jgi:hypothetical protein